MANKIQLKKINETYFKVYTDQGTLRELSDNLTFFVPGYRFMPSFKKGMWDGKIRLVNAAKRTIYIGLYERIKEFCYSRSYELEILDSIDDQEFSVFEAKKFIGTLKLPSHIQVRDYQLESFIDAIRKRRLVLLSPTNSGKSLIMYLITRYYNTKTLIVVPTTTLCDQLKMEFESEYGMEEGNIQVIYSGMPKVVDKDITISTWQSIYKLPPSWFEQFNVVMVDEVHTAKADSLKGMMESCETVGTRIGLTGTLEETIVDKLVIEGLFGPIKKVTSNRELMDQGHSAELDLSVIVLKYPSAVRSFYKRATYEKEREFLANCTYRNNFLVNLAASLEGNVLLMFRFLDHGKTLKELLEKKIGNTRPIYFVDGDVETKERTQTRLDFDKEKNAILIASTVFATGINIKNIHNIILAWPSKKRIKLLQTLGRGFRKTLEKLRLKVFDIGDDLTWKSRKNYTLQHLFERIKIYYSEKFTFKIYNVKIGDKSKNERSDSTL